jgi:hypothetical protein
MCISPLLLAQVLCGMERLLALGRAHGLHLQCHATTTVTATSTVVSHALRAALAKWQASDPGLHYAVPDEPSDTEAFLTRSEMYSALACSFHWCPPWINCLQLRSPALQVLFCEPPYRCTSAVPESQPGTPAFPGHTQPAPGMA